jgi:integron integrase
MNEKRVPSQTLPDFQRYLLARRLVPEKSVTYYAYWAHRYLLFSKRLQNAGAVEALQLFLEDLQSKKNIADWQIKQAKEAVTLYTTHFHGAKVSGTAEDERKAPDDPFDPEQVMTSMQKAIRVKHYSLSTERTYMDWTRRFFAYLGTLKGEPPSETPGAEDVREFLTYLAIRKKVSASTQNQAFNALLFLFRNVLNIDLGDLNGTVRAKRGPRLPVVLSIEEVRLLFSHIEGKQLLIAQLLYGAGLRLMELARLRVKDIDFGTGLIYVRASKGDKDRSTILPGAIREPLQQHLTGVRALHAQDLAKGFGAVYLPDALGRKYPNAAKEWGWQYVFPSSKLSVDPRSGIVRRHHMDETSIQKAVGRAARKAGIAKQVSVHTLRHSFATHLLMNGVNIREIQTLLGHQNVETTMIYTHVMRDMTTAPQSPLDLLLEGVPKTAGAGEG